MTIEAIITGTGRCGTGYMAQVLSWAGYPCGHEAVFDYRGITQPVGESLRADSSWMAVPYLSHYPGIPKILVFRHPGAVIASFLGRQFFDPRHGGDYLRFMLQREPDLRHLDPFRAACEHYVRWNRRALDYCGLVTDIENPDWGGIADLLQLPLNELGVAIRDIPLTVNAGPRADIRLEEIPDNVWETWARLKEVAT